MATTPPPAISLPVISENHWQVALNNKHFKGKLEVTCDSGRIDISTDSKVVEVERVSKYKEGFEQVKRYSKSTGKPGVLALFIDGDPDGLVQLEAARKESATNGIPIVLANCLVSTNDLLALLIQSKTETTKGATEYWLTTSSGVRHNAACRWFKVSNGRLCTNSEGRPCSICGG